MQGAPVRAGIYVRISDDQTGAAAGVARQEVDCRALADARGWSVVAVYDDNDVSASRFTNRPRPGWDRMLADVADGRLDAIVAWDQDRLVRRPIDLEHLFRVCDAAGLRLFATCSGDTDLGTGDGQFLARILGAVAAKEADNISRRVKRTHQELAAEGRFTSSRPFGFRLSAGELTPEPAEAEQVRRWVRIIVDGGTLGDCLRDAQERGTPTVRGGRWGHSTIRDVLVSARIVGDREHHGVVTRRDAWPGIVDRADHARVRSILTSPDRKVGPRSPKRLLVGVIWCGRCGERLLSHSHLARGTYHPRYVCVRRSGGCGLGIDAVRTDDLVAAALRTRMQDWVARPPGDEGAAFAELDRIEAQLAELAADYYTDRIISRPEFLAARERLAERRTQVDRNLRSTRVYPAAPVEAAQAFESAPIGVQRRIVGLLVARVVIGEASLGRHYDAGRVTVEWT